MTAFRQRAREWLGAEASRRGWTATEHDGHKRDGELARARACQKALCAAGFGAITYPKDYGGQGLDLEAQLEFNEEAAPYRLPLSELVVGLGVCAPTLLAIGTEEQKARYLPPLLHADEIWCQLFSEPGAGSDLASLSTTARGDPASGWTVQGQKVWTSGAQHADLGLLLARTGDREKGKHSGLTMFIVDMASPGITVRPLRQMDGTAHFNEVFLDSVRLPPDAVVGDVDGGWRAALVSLVSERINLGTARPTAGLVPDSDALVERARKLGLATDPIVRQALVDVIIRERILAYTGKRINGSLLGGGRPGPEGSVAKLFDSDLLGRTAALAGRINGPATTAWDPGDLRDAAWARSVLFAPGMRIAGGTDEIQKNTIAERALGLPR